MPTMCTDYKYDPIPGTWNSSEFGTLKILAPVYTYSRQGQLHNLRDMVQFATVMFLVQKLLKFQDDDSRALNQAQGPSKCRPHVIAHATCL